MKIKFSKILSVLSFGLLFLPTIALATSAVGDGLHMPNLANLFGNGLSQTQTLPELIINVINILLLFAGSIAVLFIIIGGFWYITSAGNEEQAEKGLTSLKNAVIGIVIIILSYAIITVIENTLSGV